MIVYKQLSFLNRLPSKSTLIIDIGCGDGRVLKPFYDDGYTVIGIDSNTSRIKEAQDSMPKGNFAVEKIENYQIPTDGFVIARNSLSFLTSKKDVGTFINSIISHSCYFTLFGEKDEKVLDGSALSWTRKEVDEIMEHVGNVIRFSETIGESVNLAGNPRQSHIFEIYRIVK